MWLICYDIFTETVKIAAHVKCIKIYFINTFPIIISSGCNNTKTLRSYSLCLMVSTAVAAELWCKNAATSLTQPSRLPARPTFKPVCEARFKVWAKHSTLSLLHPYFMHCLLRQQCCDDCCYSSCRAPTVKREISKPQLS